MATASADRDLIQAAMTSTGLSARALSHVMACDERTVRRWLEGSRTMPGPTRQLLRVLAMEPSLALALGTE